MAETYIRVSRQWKYLSRAVGRIGNTVDLLPTAKSDVAAARRILERAINPHDVPEKFTIGKSGANAPAIASVKNSASIDVLMRQSKYLNTLLSRIIEQPNDSPNQSRCTHLNITISFSVSLGW